MIERRDTEKPHGGDDFAFEYLKNSHESGLTGGGKAPALELADGNGVSAKGNRGVSAPAPTASEAAAEPPPELIKAAMAEMAKLQARALENSEWVGTSFANRARAMHAGEEKHAPIHGQATPQEARELIEDGVTVSPLPFPVVPPEARN